MPDFLVDKAPSAGTLVPVLENHEWYEVASRPNIYVVFPPARHRSRRVRVFTGYLAERLNG